MNFKVKTNEMLYKFSLVLAPIMRILAIAFILPAIFYSVFFVIGIVLCVVFSILFDNIAKKCIYTMQYSFNNGIFAISKIALDGKEETMEQVDCEKIYWKVCDKESNDKKSYIVNHENGFHGTDILQIADTNTTFCIMPDKYMYALITEWRNNNGLS